MWLLDVLPNGMNEATELLVTEPEGKRYQQPPADRPLSSSLQGLHLAHITPFFSPAHRSAFTAWLSEDMLYH